jgi:Zn-dependent M28 family amino/carboxypeptidase
MTDSNEELWSAEKKRRKGLLRMVIIGLSIVAVLIAVCCFWLAQPILFRPARVFGEINIYPGRLESHVRKISSEFYPRNYLNIQNLNKTADYIKSEFEKTGGRVSEYEFIVNGLEYRNVSLLIGPDEGERIVVGAHYDSAFDTRGADDNASGVAGLIELAHILAKKPPAIPVEFVAYTLEEPPFFGLEVMGSFLHAKSLDRDRVKIRLMICLEMIGYFSDERGSQGFPLSIGKLLYPSTGNFIAITGNFTNALTVRRFKRAMSQAADLPVYSINAPAFIPGVDFSDHRNYWHFGYEALMITDSAFYRNHNYHKVTDTPDTLDYVRMAEVVKGTYNAILETAK